jgi:hypothetical protein
MIVKNPSGSIGKAKTIELRPVIEPEGIDQTGSFQRSQPGVFVEVQCATLDARSAALVALIHGDLRIALL